MAKIPDGYTRVSEISSSFAGYGKVKQSILDYTADRGTQVHNIIKDKINDFPVAQERYMFQGKDIKGYVDSFDKFWEEHSPDEVILLEQRINEPYLKLSGELDCVCKINGKVTLIDWKCTLEVGKHWILQGTGYYLLYKFYSLNPIERILFIKLNKTGDSPVVVDMEPDEELFMNAFDMYHRFYKDQKINLEME